MLHEDIDDTHLCIKCNATIIGLDNYIQHRKSNCLTQHVDFPESNDDFEKTSKSLPDAYDLPYNMGADVFFSSLQLQSSSKRTSSSQMQSYPSTSGKTFSQQNRVLTRKATLTLLQNDDEWIEITGGKKMELLPFQPESPTFEEYDDDDDDEDYIPTTHTGGKWKPGNQPNKYRNASLWDDQDESEATGGKWRPGSRPSKLASMRKTYQHDDDEVPTTGGKWKPGSTPKSTWDYFDPIDTGRGHSPPPSHTKGKWVPGTKVCWHFFV